MGAVLYITHIYHIVLVVHIVHIVLVVHIVVQPTRVNDWIRNPFFTTEKIALGRWFFFDI